MALRIYALVTNEGVAASETMLCENCLDLGDNTTRARANARVAGDIDTNYASFVDVTGNDMGLCIACGRGPRADFDPLGGLIPLPRQKICPDCGEPLTVEGSFTPEEFAVNGADPVHVFCDICGKAEHPADLTPDWNGETGNHLSCEDATKPTALATAFAAVRALVTPPPPCNEVLTDPDGFAVRCMVTSGTEHSHHDYTARESVVMGNQVIDGLDVLFDADGNEIESDTDAEGNFRTYDADTDTYLSGNERG